MPRETRIVASLLGAFQRFDREHSEHSVKRFGYEEAGPQLLLQAFLQRIVNGGGRIERQYALGLGRTDLLILWSESGGEGPYRLRKHVIECKGLRKGRGLKGTIQNGLGQTVDYLDRCEAESGHLVILDRRKSKSWDERVFRHEETVGGKLVTVWGI